MDVDKFLSRAEQALRKRNPAGALVFYRQVLLAKPGHAAAWAGMLAAWRSKAERKGGASMLDKAAARTASMAGAGLRAGRKWAALTKTARAGLERNPADAGLAALLAEALEGLGHQGASLQVWQHRLLLGERDIEALKAAGRLHYALREIDEAMQCLDRAHRLDPRDPEVEKLRKNLAAEGTLKNTRYVSARSSREVMKDTTALQRAERATRRHRSREERAQDLAALEQRFRAEPSLAHRQALAAALLAAGDSDRAAQLAQEGLAEQADDPELTRLRGEALLARNRVAQAAAREAGDAEGAQRLQAERATLEVEQLGRQHAQRPDDADLRVRLARALYRAGSTDEAIDHFQALSGDPGHDLDARQGLGACFFRKGLLPLAERQLGEALDLAGGVGSDRGKEICYHLGLVCERKGDTAGALERYLQIYEVDIHYKDVARRVESLHNP